MRNRVRLWGMPLEVMLVLECKSNVLYVNQIGGHVCARGQIEGVLVPLAMKESRYDEISKLPYPHAVNQVFLSSMDRIDRILADDLSTKFIRVDRTRLSESMESWIYVTVDVPVDPLSEDPEHLLGDYFGAAFGFGKAKGVLTWPNSE